ncbi:ABC-2 type transport system ATP-binding protein [Paenibacillus phyllosphaerae]|uniref:ABC-2 type transport system ATP-binding protein n=1 Tax=Paenibacillus phyllosphaerae TaxID=274593 RepID=A0A7W5FLY3_9BACL|nr:ABC-2 type transport system ATP-binding protein [Paenibacillus phyllosphaerae]
MGLAIEVKGLYKRYGSHEVLKGMDLSVAEGGVFALLGPNGAGKTTFIHILAGLLRADRGIVRVAGYDVTMEKLRVKMSISLTGQFAAVDDMLTGTENLRMLGRLNGLSAAQAAARATELISQFDLEAAGGKRVGTYSGGMRRRLDLASSLIVPRPIVFLDEPTTGLDTRSRRSLWDSIQALASQGITVILTTQYLEEADQLADRIAVIHEGRIVASGTPAELKARIGEEVIELLNEEGEVSHTLTTDGTITSIQDQLLMLAQQAPPNARVRLRSPSMDDVFLALTESADSNSNKEAKRA